MIQHFRVTPSTSHTRDLEWVTSLAMLCLSLVLMVPGDTLSSPQFAEFHIFGVGESFWTGFFGLVGGARIIALVIDGKTPRAPWVRVIGATLGLVIWTQIFVMLRAGQLLMNNTENLGEALYGLFAVLEAISIMRASLDARYISRRRH